MAMEPMAAPQQAAAEPVQTYAPPEVIEPITKVAQSVYVEPSPRLLHAMEPTAPRAPSAAPIEPVQAVAHPVV